MGKKSKKPSALFICCIIGIGLMFIVFIMITRLWGQKLILLDTYVSCGITLLAMMIGSLIALFICDQGIRQNAHDKAIDQVKILSNEETKSNSINVSLNSTHSEIEVKVLNHTNCQAESTCPHHSQALAMTDQTAHPGNPQ